ncbi:MAG: hypothetical protein K2F98_01395 [Bacteroides sp.]|nr:hypothetical protein [Bacteroides sp.]
MKESLVYSNAEGNCGVKCADKTPSFETVKGCGCRIEYDVAEGLIGK